MEAIGTEVLRAPRLALLRKSSPLASQEHQKDPQFLPALDSEFKHT